MPQIMDSIGFAISCLYRIPIRRPARVDRASKTSSINLDHFKPFDALYVAERCSNASEELKARFRETISNRRRLLKYRSIHHKNLKSTLVPEVNLGTASTAHEPDAS